MEEGRLQKVFIAFLHFITGALVLENKDEQIGERDVLEWSSQAASGLISLNQNGIIHRDVKPDK